VSETTSPALSAAPTQCPRRTQRVASAAPGTISQWVNFTEQAGKQFERLAHLELVGGFAFIATGVATRVVFGHSGGRE